MFFYRDYQAELWSKCGGGLDFPWSLSGVVAGEMGVLVC